MPHPGYTSLYREQKKQIDLMEKKEGKSWQVDIVCPPVNQPDIHRASGNLQTTVFPSDGWDWDGFHITQNGFLSPSFIRLVSIPATLTVHTTCSITPRVEVQKWMSEKGG